MLTSSVLWKYSFIISWPILCLLLFTSSLDVMWRFFYMALVIYGYFVFEALPNPIIALMPVFLGPLLYTERTSNIVVIYFATAGLAMSTMFNALTLQYSGLHERITFWLILKIGTTPRKITCGLMIVSHFLSMWLSNTFTANIMIPVALRIQENIVHNKRTKKFKSTILVKSWLRLGIDEVLKSKPSNLGMVYIYAIILGAISGGLTFARGSPTNITYLIIYKNRIDCYISTDIWFLFTVPITLVISIVNCLWLQIAFFGMFNVKGFHSLDNMKEYEDVLKDKKPIEELYKEIGPITVHEICVGVIFILCVTLWVLREPYGYSGWQDMLTKHHIQDSAITFFISFIMVILPANYNFFDSFHSVKKYSYGLVTWLVFQRNLNWGEFFFIGCVNALGVLQNQFGTGKYFAEQLMFMKGWPLPVVIIFVSFTILWLTEFTLNVVISSIFAPILIELALLLNFHPASISFISCLCCSLSFVSPIGSRSLRMLRSVNNLNLKKYMKLGLIPKLLTYIILVTSYLTYGRLTFFDNELNPDWKSKELCYCWPCPTNQTLYEILSSNNTDY